MENRRLTITAEDSGSGVKCIYLDGEVHTENPYIYPIPTGQVKVTLQVEDIAGNKSEPVEQSVRHVDTIPPTIDSVEFGEDNSAVIIKMSDDTYGYGVKGIYINGEFKAGNPVLMGIPENVALLYLQAEDNEGNLSEVMRVRVPGRSVITDAITIESVTFNEENTQAVITAATTDPATTITGIYADGTLLDGNPVTYDISEGAQYITLQAVNNEGDKSEVVSKRVPGWSEEIESIVVTSAEFGGHNDTITAFAEDSRGIGIRGIYFNAAFLPENPATYEIPDGTRRVFVQALNEEGDKSEPVTKRVPGWTEIVDTLTVESITFSADARTATINAVSTDLAVSGFLVNGEFYPGNPLTYSVPASATKLEVQAVNVEGDMSKIVTKQVPRRESSGGGSSSNDNGSTGSKNEGKLKITILQPEWIHAKQKTKVYIKVDAPNKVQKIEATTDLIKQWQDITKTGYYELSKDAKVLVKVTDRQGRVTTKRQNIRCYDVTIPTVQAVQEGGIARITGTDDLSGVAKLYVDGEAFAEDALQDGVLLYDIPLGTQSLVVQAEDAAGNLSRELTLVLDTALLQPPASAAVVTPGNQVPAPDGELEKLVEQLKAENEKLQKENRQLQ